MRKLPAFYLGGIYCLAIPLWMEATYGGDLTKAGHAIAVCWGIIGIGLLFKGAVFPFIAVLAPPAGYLFDALRSAEGISFAYVMKTPISILPELTDLFAGNAAATFRRTLYMSGSSNLVIVIFFLAHILILLPPIWAYRFSKAYICLLLSLPLLCGIYEEFYTASLLRNLDNPAIQVARSLGQQLPNIKFSHGLVVGAVMCAAIAFLKGAEASLVSYRQSITKSTFHVPESLDSDPKDLVSGMRKHSAKQETNGTAFGDFITQSSVLADPNTHLSRVTEVNCWSCKQSIAVTDENRGIRVKCPRCGAKQKMPK